MLSIILTAHNEGREVRRTTRSLLAQTRGEIEVVLVDDASSDGCCDGAGADRVTIVRNENRIGVAASRCQGIRAASGDVFVIVDGHQRVSPGALNRCATLARQRSAIIFPDIRGFDRESATIHGATFQLCPKHGYFTAKWNTRIPRRRVTQVSSLRAPAYVMSRDVYNQVRWIRGLRNWGGSEAAVSVKAFFLNIPILHLCGTLTRHKFKKKLQYDASWDDVWRNQALIARVCFSDHSWYEYWLPKVFDGHLTDEAVSDMESESVLAQQKEFSHMKTRSDAEFWTDLLKQPVPRELSRTSP